MPGLRNEAKGEIFGRSGQADPSSYNRGGALARSETMGFLSSLFGGGKGPVVRRRLSKADKMKAWGAKVQPGSNKNYVPKGKRPK